MEQHSYSFLINAVYEGLNRYTNIVKELTNIEGETGNTPLQDSFKAIANINTHVQDSKVSKTIKHHPIKTTNLFYIYLDRFRYIY